jgi:hypothetical protein
MSLRRYLIPAGYWLSLFFSLVWLVSYILGHDLTHAALAVALLSLSISLRAFGDMKDLQTEITRPKRRRTK